MISEFGIILLFIIASILLVALVLGISKILRANKPGAEKNEVYESGELTKGDAQISFNIRFYIVAIIFVLFDVELVLLFPWSTVFGDSKIVAELGKEWLVFAGIEMLVFIGILALGLLYVWRKGLLDWVLTSSKPEEYKSPVPKQLYDDLNKKYS